MKSKTLEIGKSLSYAVTSNLLSLFISTVAIFVVPKLVGIEDYGYWQLYQFYAAYVGFLHCGWNDGIYLRYGGAEYGDLNRGLFFSQFYMLLASQVFIGIIILAISCMIMAEGNRIFIVWMTSICLVLANVRTMLLFVLQATNRIKAYARITMADRSVYAFLITLLLIIGSRSYKLMIAADLVGRFTSLLYATYLCKEIVFRNLSSFYFSFREMFENIRVGVKLMFANIAGMLIIGIVKYGIERTWDVATFGKVSLTLSVSNLLMIFVGAVGLILYPILKRTQANRLSGIYLVMRMFLMVVLFGVLMVYYPLKSVLSMWLPQYAESLKYMALIFPISIFEGNMAMLINTYLKTLRQEKMMLKINVITVACSLLLTILTTQILKNLNWAMLSIVILLAFRSIISELALSNLLGINIKKDMVFEILLTIVFILLSWFINSWLSTALYVIAYCMYLILKRKKILRSIVELKQIMQTS